MFWLAGDCFPGLGFGGDWRAIMTVDEAARHGA